MMWVLVSLLVGTIVFSFHGFTSAIISSLIVFVLIPALSRNVGSDPAKFFLWPFYPEQQP